MSHIGQCLQAGCLILCHLRHARVANREPNTLTCLVDRDGPVKVSFFGLPHLKRIAEPERAGDTLLPCARAS